VCAEQLFSIGRRVFFGYGSPGILHRLSCARNACDSQAPQRILAGSKVCNGRSGLGRTCGLPCRLWKKVEEANSYGPKLPVLHTSPALKTTAFIRGLSLLDYPVEETIVYTTVALHERQWKVTTDHVSPSPDGQTAWHKLFARRASRQGIQQTKPMGPQVANHSRAFGVVPAVQLTLAQRQYRAGRAVGVVVNLVRWCTER
jgi:hypothetical protein